MTGGARSGSPVWPLHRHGGKPANRRPDGSTIPDALYGVQLDPAGVARVRRLATQDAQFLAVLDRQTLAIFRKRAVAARCVIHMRKALNGRTPKPHAA